MDVVNTVISARFPLALVEISEKLDGHLKASGSFKGTLDEKHALRITEAFTAFATKHLETLDAVVKKANVMRFLSGPIGAALRKLDESLYWFTSSLFSLIPSTHADTIKKQVQSIKAANDKVSKAVNPSVDFNF